MEQVFIHDPLYKWALTPLGAQQRQKDDPMVGDSNPAEPQSSSAAAAAGMPPDAVAGTDTTLANADAERALLRLKQKLAGMEGGERVLKPAVSDMLACVRSHCDVNRCCIYKYHVYRMLHTIRGMLLAHLPPAVEHYTMFCLYACSCCCVACQGCTMPVLECDLQGKVRREE